ncbi:MAG: hypothetical protein U0984_11920, partial [Prosthecobacter sp.]|nr:hypothetical protein [Prosthecobacter sp.]
MAYLLERFGRQRFQAILRDLAEGKRINEAIAANTEAVEKLEKDFDAFIKDKAVNTFGALADWKKPEAEAVNPLDPASLAAYLKEHPDNLWAIHLHAAEMMDQEKWEEAIRSANDLIQLVPEDFDTGSGYQIKAAALRKLGRAEEETALLRVIAERDSSAMPVFLRLIEIDLPKKDWPQVQANARKAIALNPFLRTPQQALGEAAEALGLGHEAVAAYGRVLILDPSGAAMTHFRLAKLVKEKDATLAKRHLLDSL